MILPNYKKSCDHEGNRIKVCLFCCQRSEKMINITGCLLVKVKKLVCYDVLDDCLPTVLCPTCKTFIYQEKKLENLKKEYMIYKKAFIIFRRLGVIRDLKLQVIRANVTFVI